MVAEFEAAIPDCARRARVEIEVVERWHFGSEVFHADCIAGLTQAADDLGITTRKMLSQAGHDAYHMTKVCPTALVFSPCHEGITHNEAEHIEPEATLPRAMEWRVPLFTFWTPCSKVPRKAASWLGPAPALRAA
jgi:N-carbamoyl-L-amino-acid hydrolase